MHKLPNHGRIDCKKCYSATSIDFDKTKCTEGNWRITANPLSWGNTEAEVIVLGFSKGPTQAGALERATHDEIAYKGSRSNVGKILAHIGVLSNLKDQNYTESINNAIADKFGKFHFGSLIRCTVERYDEKESKWKGSGGGMLDKFIATSFGQRVTKNCTENFLIDLPSQTKLVVMFGLGTKLNYVKTSFDLYKTARGGNWTWLNEIAYTDGKIVVVHVEHFASQGALIPQWLGRGNHPRSNYGHQAQEAVKYCFKSF